MKLPTPYRIVLTLLLAGLPLAGCVKGFYGRWRRPGPYHGGDL